MDIPRILTLPDELLESIVYYLGPEETVACGLTCRQLNKITHEPLVWRRHCRQTWRFWKEGQDFEERLKRPPVQTKWQQLFNQRTALDQENARLFDTMLQEQSKRVERMDRLAQDSYDAKDLLLRLRDTTPDDAEDVLARRYHAAAVLGMIHRRIALDKWKRLQQQQMIGLEEVLGSFDLFVLNGTQGDLTDIAKELDRLANAIRARDPDFDDLSVRRKACQITKYLRAEHLVGNPDTDNYHALRNNFLSMALFDEPHTSLPLQSAAIYCAVARRLGVNAKPSNFPMHVHVVIEAPTHETLDGRAKGAPLPGVEQEAELMHVDPWRSSEEISRSELTLRLSQMGAPAAQHAHHLGATSTLEIANRTGRNIMNSVQHVRDRYRGNPDIPSHPDVEGAWYAMLWSMVLLGQPTQAGTMHTRRQCLPYLIEHWQTHFPEDLGLIRDVLAPMFQGEGEQDAFGRIIETAHAADRNKPAPSPRTAAAQGVSFKIGHYFRHRRYQYEGVIVGWDVRCGAEPRWIQQMRVDDLPKGREQPFYNVVANDRSSRYVAQENIELLDTYPADTIMRMAGKHFKRYDQEKKMFVSNIKDEYPDD
ncbi:hypothetical protein MBLNU230_g1406t1 [Neophaeotheca triangularis]